MTRAAVAERAARLSCSRRAAAKADLQYKRAVEPVEMRGLRSLSGLPIAMALAGVGAAAPYTCPVRHRSV
jgi:hypothetical protein